jgi:hypothetical protein
MSKQIDEYKLFIDDMVDLSKSAVSRWVVEKGFPKVSENLEKNEFLKSLTDTQKLVLAKLIQDAKSSGIHDVLFYLNEQQVNHNLKIFKDNVELQIKPFGTEMNFDFIARLKKDD